VVYIKHFFSDWFCVLPGRSDEYHMVALAGLEGDPRVTGLDRDVFERAPRKAMEHALRHINTKWGSIESYLEQAGFPLKEQQMLKERLVGKRGAQVGVGEGSASVIGSSTESRL
jgi:hypothetical protein